MAVVSIRAMRVFHDVAEVLPVTHAGCITAIGNFDGVHLGHQALILRCVRLARERDKHAAVLTFSPHPSEVLKPGTAVRRLTLTSEKLLLLEQLGVQTVLAQRFTPELSQLSPDAFFHRFLEQGLRASRIHVGRDFRFGKDRTGDTTWLKSMAESSGMELEVQPEVSHSGVRISSTAIRDLVCAGDIPTAGKLLGRPYFVFGTIVRGDQRGRQLGFPTANLSIASEKLLPPNGVYVGRFHWKRGAYRCVVNIGLRPTFTSADSITVEAHVLDFNHDIYDQFIRLELFERLRPERKFSNREELVRQIKGDVEQAKSSRSLD